MPVDMGVVDLIVMMYIFILYLGVAGIVKLIFKYKK